MKVTGRNTSTQKSFSKSRRTSNSSHPDSFVFDIEKFLKVCTPISGLLFLIGYAWSFTPDMEKWSLFFYILSLIVGLVFILRSLWNDLVQKNLLSISFIVVIVLLWVLYIGEYRTAATIACVFSLAEFFWNQKKAKSPNKQ